LQKVQNAAARVLTLTRKYDNIRPVLRDLHWLPVVQRVKYKILLLTYKALHEQAPGYISDLIEIYKPKRNLRSASSKNLVMTSYNLKSYGYRAFYHSAPSLWNALPLDIKTANSLTSFKSLIKTYLFREAYITA